MVVPGFWDGGQSFRIRFTPIAAGEWSYTTGSEDPGLDGRRGTLRATTPRPGRNGFVRRDLAHPYHFVFDDGTRYFMFGNTY